MDNEILKSHSDDEYHFPEDETTASFTTQKVASERGLKKKNIFIAIVVVLLLICIYKLADVLLSSHKDHTITSGRLSSFTSNTSAQNEAIPVVPQTSPVTDTSQPPTPIASMDDRLTSVENLSTANQSNIDKLTSQLSDMQTTLNGLNDRLQTLTNAMQDLTNKVQLQEAQVAASQAPKIRPVYRHIRVIPQTIYFVKAMIPNRAWLATAGGRTLTVSLGDSLPGYGVVVIIDPEQGTLTTSTGAIIGYSPNDR